MARWGFIGGGKMAEALLRGGLAAGILKPQEVLISTPGKDRQEYLRKTYGVAAFFDNPRLVRECETVVLAVKPQVLSGVLEEIREAARKHRPLFISVVAGFPLERLKAGLGGVERLVRVMPNTPALVLSGVSALCKAPETPEEDLSRAEALFSALGEVVRVPEALFDAVTGLSGSGPAYVFAFIEALVDGGVREGLSREVAERLAVGTVLGAARLMKETGKDPYALKAMVTSPGGTTIAGLKALADRGFHGAVMEAVAAATRRARELSGG
ncbi:pyrroline-5-carboxylate reductase [Thermosulfurimonas marina]|uniref:Pyrroline-5-carboxylate reductase n=1 Tax=Thermosulfurimonas marina TaxID=2047767 RepID=A0A6H1WS92_9BACT|nr:pyrroline-5-carboxylate reductase [Thermosulfurimonas marina]QJA06063.1 pyrroline-5-carboxylate reductase [Thermosulfurimonas marina]